MGSTYKISLISLPKPQMIQLVISSTIIEQVSLETVCIHSKFGLVETTFPFSLARCAWHETRKKKKSGGKYNKHFPAPILSFLLPKMRSTTLQLPLSLSALGSRAIPSGGVGYGWACLCSARVLHSLSSLGEARVPLTWHRGHGFSTLTQHHATKN